jgi:hypothetical protein
VDSRPPCSIGIWAARVVAVRTIGSPVVSMAEAKLLQPPLLRAPASLTWSERCSGTNSRPRGSALLWTGRKLPTRRRDIRDKPRPRRSRGCHRPSGEIALKSDLSQADISSCRVVSRRLRPAALPAEDSLRLKAGSVAVPEEDSAGAGARVASGTRPTAVAAGRRSGQPSDPDPGSVHRSRHQTRLWRPLPRLSTLHIGGETGCPGRDEVMPLTMA